MSAREVVSRAGQFFVGLVAAAVVAEGAFWLRDHGAFPHVNFYLADAALGVRLRPHASERISFGGNPVTQVRINGDGYRGADLPPPRPDEILVVGDSQTFGLGVEEQETFSARLAELTGRPVVNAGVPTYGPDEYDAVVAEMLARRKPSVVVYTVNVANDLFEADRPNRERHAVWDGWAVRKETAPARSFAFPGRAWLFGHSHLMFSLRKVSHARDAEAVDRGVPSEGTWTDLVGAGQNAAEGRQKARAELHEKVRQDLAARGKAEQLAQVNEEKIASAADLRALGIALDTQGVPFGAGDWLKAARSSVGDIVSIDLGEEGRDIPVTASLIRQAGEWRGQLEQALRRKASAGGRRAGRALSSLADWQRSVDALRAMELSPARFLRHASPILPHIERVKQLCEANGARLVVLVLPLDVTVSDGEWAKYGAQAEDMRWARLLVDDLVRASEESRVSALDATPSLAAAEPGAFLKRDLHLSPQGHAAVARALAAKLAEPPPEFPTGLLAADRTKLPRSGEWPSDSEASVDVKNPRCSVFRSAEWWRVACLAPGDSTAKPREVTLLKGGRGDALTFATPTAMYLVAPVLPGDTLAADFVWSDSVQRLAIDEKGNAAFTDGSARAGGGGEPNALEAKILACLAKGTAKESWWGLQLGADADCDRTYGDDCQRLRECAEASPVSPPDCPPGFVNAGVLGRCHQLCGPGRPCAHGQCDAWPGAHVCE